MSKIKELLHALDDQTIAQVIGKDHDNAREAYRPERREFTDINQFFEQIGDCYNSLYTTCVSHGGYLSPAVAIGKAKEILTQHYRREKGNFITAYNDAKSGTNHGLHGIFDLISDSIKAESIEHYMRQVFDQLVTPNSWEEKVEIIREFIVECGLHLSGDIKADHPEQYANNYEDLIRTYVETLRSTSRIFRRL